MNNTLHTRLRHHVTGAIERGEAQAIVEIPALHTPASWEHSAENAESTAQNFLSAASALGSAIKWMSDNAYKCEQAKSNPNLVDTITGDAALDVLCALRGFAMALDRAALIKGEA